MPSGIRPWLITGDKLGIQTAKSTTYSSTRIPIGVAIKAATVASIAIRRPLEEATTRLPCWKDS